MIAFRLVFGGLLLASLLCFAMYVGTGQVAWRRRGVLITGVLNDSPAARGGIRPGDVVLRVADRAVTSREDLLATVAALAPGSEASVRVQRGGDTVDLRLTVGERPAPPAPR